MNSLQRGQMSILQPQIQLSKGFPCVSQVLSGPIAFRCLVLTDHISCRAGGILKSSSRNKDKHTERKIHYFKHLHDSSGLQPVITSKYHRIKHRLTQKEVPHPFRNNYVNCLSTTVNTYRTETKKIHRI